MALRFRWKLTWPDDPRAADDFLSQDKGPTERTLRIMPAGGSAHNIGRWHWNAADERQIGSGYKETAGEAAAAAEAAWLRRHPHDGGTKRQISG